MSILAWIVDSTQRDFLVNNLNEQRKDAEFCDVLLKVSGHTLPTHGCVLSASSPVFRDLIRTDRPLPPHLTGMPREIDVRLPELADKKTAGGWLPAMVDLINYIYTGTITLRADTIDVVIDLAEAFMLEGLLALVKTHVKRERPSPNIQPKSDFRQRRSTVERPMTAIRKSPRFLSALAKAPIQESSSTAASPDGNSDESLDQMSDRSPAASPCASPDSLPDESQDRVPNDCPDRVPIDCIDRVPIESPDLLPVSSSSDQLPDASAKQSSDDWTDCLPDELLDVLMNDFLFVRAPFIPRRNRSSSPVAVSVVPSTPVPESPAEESGDREMDVALTAAVPVNEKKKKKARLRNLPATNLFRCPHCLFESSDGRDIALHKRDHPSAYFFRCISCKLFLRHHFEMVEHLREANHEETDCCLCGSQMGDRRAFLEHIDKHADPKRPFFCWICHRPKRTRLMLLEHMAVHKSALPFKCDQCPKAFKWKTSLVVHKLAHDQVRKHLCDQCGFSSVHIQNLRHHLRKHRLPPLCCEHCSYQTHCKHRLKNHQVRHSTTKDFVCDVCGLGFKGRTGLRTHTKSFHDPHGPKLHCTLCDFFTALRDKLRMHSRKHHGGMGAEALNAPTVIEPRCSI